MNNPRNQLYENLHKKSINEACLEIICCGMLDEDFEEKLADESSEKYRLFNLACIWMNLLQKNSQRLNGRFAVYWQNVVTLSRDLDRDI